MGETIGRLTGWQLTALGAWAITCITTVMIVYGLAGHDGQVMAAGCTVVGSMFTALVTAKITRRKPKAEAETETS